MSLFSLLLRLLQPRRKRYRYFASPAAARRGRQTPSFRLNNEIQIDPPHPQAALVGRCWVIDGDTIDIAGTRIRLAGVDAPEIADPYGEKAKFLLMRLCKGQEVRAVFDGSLSHERSVATCFLPDGRDLSAEMVKAGLALDWSRFSKGQYRHMEPDGARKKLWRVAARQQSRSPASMPD